MDDAATPWHVDLQLLETKLKHFKAQRVLDMIEILDDRNAMCHSSIV